MTRKIENVWSTATSPPDQIAGHCNVIEIATASGADDSLEGTIAIRRAENMFWTGPYGENEAQPDEFTGTDRAHAQEMAEEYYTGALASGSETVIEDNITYRIIEED